MDKKKIGKAALITGAVLGTTFVVMRHIAKKQYPKSVYDDKPEEKNPMERKKVVFVECEDDEVNADGKRGHLEAVGTIEHIPTFYEKYVKRGFDVAVSFGGIVALAPVFAISALAIKIDDPGPVLFKQKRITNRNSYFQLLKLRSMSVNTPSNVPTHMLKNGGITKVGAILRKTSADELPQLFNIFEGSMSLIGPRPALWNQDYLTSERDKYGANDVKSGLTGWAQINGRDELEIPEKARLDGEYVAALKKSSWSGFMMDMKCFFGSISAVLKRDGIVEGGTGELNKVCEIPSIEEIELSVIEPKTKKRILITGENSYIGESFKKYIESIPDFYEINTIDTINLTPKPSLFEGYDVVFHVAGIAHIKETEENNYLYYAINRDLTVKIAEAAKKAGVKQFIALSSMSVYGKETGHITKLTEPDPYTAYGKSKLEADRILQTMDCDSFKVAILRPPMVYGKGCKGNYQQLRNFAINIPVFPNYSNQRSMIYIGNLCEFVKNVIDSDKNGIFLPQNKEYVCSKDMVKAIATYNGKKCAFLSIFNPLIRFTPFSIIKKVFGSLTYDKVDVINKYSFDESIKLTEE